MGTVVRYAGAAGVGFAIDDAALPARAEALASLSEPAAGVQTPVKPVLGAAVRQAFSNDPFEDYPRVVLGYKRLFEEEKAKERTGALHNQAVEGFLRRTFHSLTFIPQISFDTTNISESVERKALNTALVHYRRQEWRGRPIYSKMLMTGCGRYELYWEGYGRKAWLRPLCLRAFCLAYGQRTCLVYREEEKRGVGEGE